MVDEFDRPPVRSACPELEDLMAGVNSNYTIDMIGKLPITYTNECCQEIHIRAYDKHQKRER